MDDVVQALELVRYPESRLQVYGSLEALSDLEFQKKFWGIHFENQKQYIDFDMAIHILYDDFAVLPDPMTTVGWFIFADEVPFLEILGREIDKILPDLNRVEQSEYVKHPNWISLVKSAKSALVMFRKNGNGYGKPWSV